MLFDVLSGLTLTLRLYLGVRYCTERLIPSIVVIFEYNVMMNGYISETIPYAAGTRPFGQPLMLSRVLPENGDIPSKQTKNSSGGFSGLFKKYS